MAKASEQDVTGKQPRTRILIEHLKGSLAGQRQTFDGGQLLFGRHPQCDVVFHPFEDSKVSKRHADLLTKRDDHILRDRNSLNGTYLNGRRIHEARVRRGDEIQLGYGGPIFRVSWEGEFIPGRTTAFRAILVRVTDESRRRMRLVIILMILMVVISVSIISYMAILLSRQGMDPARWIVSRYSQAIFLLIQRTPVRSARGRASYKEHGFCTAFSYHDRGILATNAHCIAWMDAHRSSSSQFLARMNLYPERSYLIDKAIPHPGFSTATSPDVGLLLLRLGSGERLPAVIPLATQQDLNSLGPGETIYTLGFPGKVINTACPSASFYRATISRMTNFRNVVSTPQENWLLWHDLSTSKGTSGSPIFNRKGLVVAINNGGLGEGLNFGVRIDLFRRLLANHSALVMR